VLIVVDTLRGDALGCYNDDHPDLSPEIDAMARNGAQFLNVTSQSTWTRPAMGSMLTSLYPRDIGIYREKYDVLPERVVTLAEALHQDGYETVGITANPNLNRVFNFEQGFDTYIESAAVWDWMKPEPGQKKVRRKRGLPDSRGMLQQMLDHARSSANARPQYLQIVLMEVHEGWSLVRPEFKLKYRDLPGVPEGYWDGVRQVSFDVGWFVEQLTSLPGWTNTLFILTSDHGQGLHDHPDVLRSWGHGLLLYESQVKVPLILYHPTRDASRLRPGPARDPLRPQRVGDAVRLMDLMPTVLDYLGIPPPSGIRGRSLLPLLMNEGQGSGLPPYFVTETHYAGSDKLAAHSPEWTYIENNDGQPGVNAVELQPARGPQNGRLTDQIEERPDVARELADHLREWERQVPKSPSIQPANQPSDDALEQLEALGYVK
jgi:arylsulfatase A-like enzyme